MASVAARQIREQLKLERSRRPVPLAQSRARWIEDAHATPLPDGTNITPVGMGGVNAEWITQARSTDAGMVLLLHGGGYRAGNCVTHRNLAARVALASGCPVLVPDYRLAPEHPFPAAIQDCLAVFGALLRTGMSASDIVLMGDSAGGGLAIAMMLALRNAGAPLPASAVLMSPWTDLRCRGQSYETRREMDPNMSRADLLSAAEDYRGKISASHPMISPILADLTGLPPMLVQVGGLEIMLDDSVVFASRAEQAGCEVDLEVWPGLWHVFQNWAGEVPEAQEALDKVGHFVKGRLSRNRAA